MFIVGVGMMFKFLVKYLAFKRCTEMIIVNCIKLCVEVFVEEFLEVNMCIEFMD